MTYHVLASTGAAVGNTGHSHADEHAGPTTATDSVAITTHADVADLKVG